MCPIKLVKGSENYVWFSDQRLGKGAMGTVYLARHRRKGVKRAAKTFNPHTKMTEFIQRELRILRQMTDHEHVVKLIAIEEETYSKDNVVIMELCAGGSLQRLLDEPENYNGLAHEEWLLVFTHTFKALSHLHENKMIHRDIKPGNILLHIRSDGSHIYKLTDFGTARIQIDDEEGFKSLCGTEEYLHPELHSSAFIRRIPGQVYGHYVDIWSFGVTMYQCATGRLPFRPREGIRKNKQMMNDLMTKKARGVISRYEREDGQIVDERELPPTSRLFTGSKQLVEHALARVLDLTEPWRESDFFSAMTEFCDRKTLYVYSINVNDIICIHLKQSDSMMHLREEITKYTDTPANNQILLTKDGPLEALVTPIEEIDHYPITSPQEPIYVIDRNLRPEGNMSSFDDLPSLPEPAPGESLLVSDAHWAAQVCGNIYHFMYLTQYLVWMQSHLLILRISLNDMIKELCQIVEHSIWRQQQTQGYLRRLWSKLCLHISLCHRASVEQATLQSMMSTIGQSMDLTQRKQHDLRGRYDNIIDNMKRFLPLVKKGQKPSCATHDRCREKGEVLIKEALPLYEAIREDKSKGELSHNDMEIHKYSKSELKRTHRRLRDNVVQHCVQQARLQYQETTDFCRTLLDTLDELKALERLLMSFDKEQEQGGNAILELLSRDDFDGPSESNTFINGDVSAPRSTRTHSGPYHIQATNYGSYPESLPSHRHNDPSPGSYHSGYRYLNGYNRPNESRASNGDIFPQAVNNRRISCDSAPHDSLRGTTMHGSGIPQVSASAISGSASHWGDFNAQFQNTNAHAQRQSETNISGPDICNSAVDNLTICDTLYEVDHVFEVDDFDS